MNYRAIEDLINILVKKAGYNLGDTTTLEDTDILTKRRGILEDRIEKLNAHIKKEEYVDKEDKARDLEEKKISRRHPRYNKESTRRRIFNFKRSIFT